MGLFTSRKPRSTVFQPWTSLGLDFRPTIRGESHYQPELRALRRRSNSWTASLLREPGNKFDKNAVSVWIDGQRVAYLAKQEAEELRVRLDALTRENCVIAFPVTLYGGDKDRKHIGVFAD